MEKRIAGGILILCVMIGLLTIPFVSSAKTTTGKQELKVTFTKDETWTYNFSKNAIVDAISDMQPGDSIEITLQIVNEHPSTTNWYMTNEVLKTLEETITRAPDGTVSGGAYTYKLDYYDPLNNRTQIYSSETVGGEYEDGRVVITGEKEGLKEATDSLEDYFYLDTLASGEVARVVLSVGLDGESLPNAYQDTLARLQMNFAVELTDETPDRSDTPQPSPSASATATATPTPRRSATPRSSGTSTSAVRTGERSLVPYIIIAAVSGLLLLIFAVYNQRARRKNKKE